MPTKKQSIFDAFIGELETDKGKSKLENLLKVPKEDNNTNTPHIHVSKPNNIYQTDLLFLPTDRDGSKYALVCVDLATNAMDAIGIKNKDVKTVVDGLKKMFKRKYLKKKPRVLEVDAGKEFDKEFENEMKKIDVLVRRKKAGRSRSQAKVEGMNDLLGKLLNRAMLVEEMNTGEISTDWVDNLKRAVVLINDRLKHKPREYSGEPKCDGSACDLLQQGTKVRVILDKPRDYLTGQRLHGKFRASDIRWDPEIRTITQVFIKPDQPPMYRVSGIDNVAYTKAQLQVVPENEKNPSSKYQQKYIVEKIVGKKKMKGVIYYNVKWKNYPTSQNTWEKRTELLKDVPKLIKQFEKDNKSD